MEQFAFGYVTRGNSCTRKHGSPDSQTSRSILRVYLHLISAGSQIKFIVYRQAVKGDGVVGVTQDSRQPCDQVGERGMVAGEGLLCAVVRNYSRTCTGTVTATPTDPVDATTRQAYH